MAGWRPDEVISSVEHKVELAFASSTSVQIINLRRAYTARVIVVGLSAHPCSDELSVRFSVLCIHRDL